MSSRQGIPLVQDSPPPGGYPPVKPIRRLWRTSGLGGFATFVVTGAVLVLGFFKVTKFNLKRRDDFDEMRQARLHILPYLQAESDRRTTRVTNITRGYLRMKKQALEEEAKIMKDVPGWVVGESTYKTGFYPPSK